jgi:NAD(P)-dependent dehydrogenase (short-subunit alcohol dehydrogenase family)
MGLLDGRRALVTGAAQGIGKAIVEAFRFEGAVVEGVDLQVGACEYTLDLSDLGAIEPFVQELSVCPDILVNVAGICLTRPFFEIDTASFEKTLRVNVLGLFALSQAVARRWADKNKPGTIVNVASNSGFLPKLEQLDYGSSKAAVISLTRSSALSLAPFGIRVNAIAPGVIETPMTQAIAAQRAAIRGVSPEETLQPVLNTIPLRRMGTAEEVAQVAVFLASDRASYVTGQTYLVDGGQVMR